MGGRHRRLRSPRRTITAGRDQFPWRTSLTTPAYDVVGIGNAIVDVLSQAEDAFITETGMTKGSMQLMFSPAEADALYAKMGPGIEASGGSAANTVAGIAALGGKGGFIGQVAEDQLGEGFAPDIPAVRG